VSAPQRAVQSLGILSRRTLEELGKLQSNVHSLCTERNAALRMFVASRRAATTMAQREFWLEFACADQEYRVAVRRLAQFCLEHRAGSRRALRPGQIPEHPE
jgi:hypothetical protein